MAKAVSKKIKVEDTEADGMERAGADMAADAAAGGAEAAATVAATADRDAEVASPAPVKPLVFGLEPNPPLHLLNKAAARAWGERNELNYQNAEKYLARVFRRRQRPVS